MLLELVEEHRDASKDYVSGCVLNTRSLSDLDLNVLSEYRGQVFAFDAVLNIEEFLADRVEVKDEKTHTDGIGSID